MKRGSYMIGFIVGALFSVILDLGFKWTVTSGEMILFMLLMVVLVGIVNWTLAYKVLRS